MSDQRSSRARGDGMEWITRLRFGPGIANKLSTGFVALVALFAVALLRFRSDALVVLILLLAIGCGYFFLRTILAFARENPGPALLEGQHLIRYRGQELAAKNQRLLEDAPAADPERRGRLTEAVETEAEDG